MSWCMYFALLSCECHIHWLILEEPCSYRQTASNAAQIAFKPCCEEVAEVLRGWLGAGILECKPFPFRPTLRRDSLLYMSP